MNHPPIKPYSGLTIVMSNPSRFDVGKNRLLSGSAGECVRRYYVGPDLDIDSCHIFDLYDIANSRGLLEKHGNPESRLNFHKDTRVVLLMGKVARDFIFPETSNYTVNAQRGGVRVSSQYPGICFIPTYSPQDTFDPVELESSHNSLLATDENEGVPTLLNSGEAIEEEEGSDKDHSPTSRSNWRFWLERDIAKAKKILNDSKAASPETPYQVYATRLRSDIYPSYETIKAFFNSLKDVLYFDVETDSNLNVNTLGFASDNWAICIPTIHFDYRPAYSYFILGKIFRLIQRVFRDDKIKVVIHNSSFDLSVMALKYNIHPPRNVYDTMLANHRIFPEAEKSLGHCVSLWTNELFHKDEGIFMPHNSAQEEKLWDYNVKDLLTMRLVHKAQIEYASNDKGLRDSIAQANKAILPYFYNTLLGIRIDTAQVNNLVDKNNRLLTQYQRILDILVGERANMKLLPTSSKSCCKYFYDMLGYKVEGRTPSGAPSAGEAELYKIKLKHPENIAIDFCIKYRQLVKESGQIQFKLWKPKFLDTQASVLEQKPSINNSLTTIVPAPVTLSINSYSCDRATTGWKLSGTKTFRLASAKWLNGVGTNLQNPSKGALKVFCADVGKEFVQVDQAGAEALIVAYLTDKGGFRDLFLNGIKSHNYVALHLYIDIWTKYFSEARKWLLLSPADLKKEPRWKDYINLIKSNEHAQRYYIAKKTCHAANYGMKFSTFVKAVLLDSGGTVVLTNDNAKRFLGIYHSLFPEIQRWHKETQEILFALRELRNLFGFPRKFYGVFGDAMFREAFAFPPQSTVGTITNIAFEQMDKHIQARQPEWDLLNNKHDSILMQVPLGQGIEAGRLLSHYMEQHLISHKGERFQMKSDCSIGLNWEKRSEYNPDGMEEVKL